MTAHGRARPGSVARRRERELRELALEYPETHEDMPWGHSAIKVRGKQAFVFLGTSPEGLFLSVKLPHSNVEALDHAFTEATGYGLGRSGWVTARFGVDEEPPLELLRAWLDESFRAVAPKTLVRQLDGSPPATPPRRPARKRRARKA